MQNIATKKYEVHFYNIYPNRIIFFLLFSKYEYQYVWFQYSNDIRKD